MAWHWLLFFFFTLLCPVLQSSQIKVGKKNSSKLKTTILSHSKVLKIMYDAFRNSTTKHFRHKRKRNIKVVREWQRPEH